MSDSKTPIFYRSSGLICGKYLPTEDNPSEGILMTVEGFFPASVTEEMLDFLVRKSKKRTLRRKHHFVCFVQGLPDIPHYQLRLINRFSKNNLPKMFPKNNMFVLQGFVKERKAGTVILRIQKNLRPERSSQEIEESINYIKVTGCPGQVRTSQFWFLCTSIKDGFLHYESGELLAKAKTAKDYLKTS